MNLTAALQTMSPGKFFSRFNNSQYHNLCSHLEPPQGLEYLLGLGHKFCIQTGRPSANASIATVTKLKRNIRMQHWIHSSDHEPQNDSIENPNYIPKIYEPSSWAPPPIEDGDIEMRMLDFATQLHRAVTSANNKKAKFNLSYQQHSLIRQLKDDKRFIVCLTDKNLGPAIIERTVYFSKAFADHLGKDQIYQRLTVNTANKIMAETKQILTDLVDKHQSELCEAEKTYFQRSIQKVGHRTPQFYLLFKVHKVPLMTRPVVSCVGSFPEIFSRWLDHHMAKFLPLASAHLKDSNQVLEETKLLGILPIGARLFTADAISMYTNILTAHGYEVFEQWFNLNDTELPRRPPRAMFLAVLLLVMQKNVFQFDDTYWLQKSGTAMGTSCACMFATLYYAWHERQTILVEFQAELLYYRRFIDDICGVWISTEERWNEFQAALSFGNLRWTVSDLCEEVNFLDLTISIDSDRRLRTRTFQKPMNLFLYLPPHSAHPPGVLKSLVYGNLNRFYRQNSKVEDYIQLVTEFAGHLIARGHDVTSLEPLFMEAANRLDNKNSGNRDLSDTNSGAPLILHWDYHPNGVSRQELRHIYARTIDKHSGFERVIVAQHRPKNLRNALMRTQLEEPDGSRVSNYFPNNPPET